MKYENAMVSEPRLEESQIKFRLGLVRQRTRTYPLDSMDFIMMDLERPDGCCRHAHWCTGDLSGRLLEMLSAIDGVDGQSDPRMKELFERTLLQSRRSGWIGRYARNREPTAPEGEPAGTMARTFPAMVRYRRGRSTMALAQGALGRGGASVVNADKLRVLAVQRGDTICLVVGPRGNHQCDTTLAELTAQRPVVKVGFGISRKTSPRTFTLATRMPILLATTAYGPSPVRSVEGWRRRRCCAPVQFLVRVLRRGRLPRRTPS